MSQPGAKYEWEVATGWAVLGSAPGFNVSHRSAKPCVTGLVRKPTHLQGMSVPALLARTPALIHRSLVHRLLRPNASWEMQGVVPNSVRPTGWRPIPTAQTFGTGLDFSFFRT